MKNTTLIAITILFTACTIQKTITMKKFDIEKFNKHKNHLNRYIDTLENGTVIKQNEYDDEYTEIIKIKSEYFKKYKRYFKNGNLKLIGEYFDNDFQKGIWREYDEQGNLIKETDYDKGFEYTWEDLLKYLKKRKVEILGRYTSIRKDNGEWWVYYVEGMYIYNIRINGKTGKITMDDKDVFEEGS